MKSIVVFLFLRVSVGWNAWDYWDLFGGFFELALIIRSSILIIIDVNELADVQIQVSANEIFLKIMVKWIYNFVVTRAYLT